MITPVEPPIQSMAALWGDALGMIRRRLHSLLLLGITARLIWTLVLAPLTSLIVGFLVERKGRFSFGNNDIVMFLLSPTGVATLIVAATLFVFAQTVEFASLFLLGRDDERGGSPFVRATWRTIKALPRLFDLAARECVILIVIAAPFLGMIGLVYWALWSKSDLNYLVEVKPPKFWMGAGVAGVFVAIYLLIAIWLFVRWSFAIPEVVFHGASGRTALRASARKVKGAGWRVTRVALAWLLVAMALDAVTISALRVFSLFTLEHTSDAVVIAVATAALLLAVHAILIAAVGFVTNAFAAFLILQMREGPNDAEKTTLDQTPSWLPTRVAVIAWAGAIAGLAGILSFGLVASLHIEDDILVTGHRGDAHDAPENTVAAFKQAIKAGADCGELDVQLSKDGFVVVAHDVDLMRLMKLNRKIRDMTLEELRRVDLGSAFSAEFQGEHVPTLEEIFVAVGDKLKVLIEIKVYAGDDTPELVKRTIDLIHLKKFSDKVIVISLSYEALQLVRKLDPKLKVGYLVADSVGNLTRLDVNYLMVRAAMANPPLISEARRRGKSVDAWTVDDPNLMVRLWDRGVANVITNNPREMVEMRKRVREMSDVERLLLRARYLLGG
jgi:glycerophosphoryl diester phosphodiesterase